MDLKPLYIKLRIILNDYFTDYVGDHTELELNKYLPYEVDMYFSDFLIEPIVMSFTSEFSNFEKKITGAMPSIFSTISSINIHTQYLRNEIAHAARKKHPETEVDLLEEARMLNDVIDYFSPVCIQIAFDYFTEMQNKEFSKPTKPFKLLYLLMSEYGMFESDKFVNLSAVKKAKFLSLLFNLNSEGIRQDLSKVNDFKNEGNYSIELNNLIQMINGAKQDKKKKS